MVNRAFDWIIATLTSCRLISVSQVIALFILGTCISKVNKDNLPKGSIYSCMLQGTIIYINKINCSSRTLLNYNGVCHSKTLFCDFLVIKK